MSTKSDKDLAREYLGQHVRFDGGEGIVTAVVVGTNTLRIENGSQRWFMDVSKVGPARRSAALPMLGCVPRPPRGLAHG